MEIIVARIFPQEIIGSTKPKKSAKDKIAAHREADLFEIVADLDKKEILDLSDWLRRLAQEL